LGEFSPIGRLFTLEFFSKYYLCITFFIIIFVSYLFAQEFFQNLIFVSHIFGFLFHKNSSKHSNCYNIRVGLHFGRLFQKSIWSPWARATKTWFFSASRVRVARWFSVKSEIPFLGKFWGSCNGRCWCILWPFGKFNGLLVNLMAFW
jgi:hypothetical protein